MKRKKMNKVFQFLFPFFFAIGIILIVLGINDYKIVNLKYQEDNNIKYKVFLKENNFFDTPYLEENRTYIASLIDYIDIDFHYNLKFNMPINGDYKYKYVATVMANKNDSEEYYWKKEYDLSEERTGSIENNSILTLDDNIKVDYSKYNQILNDFKQQYPVASNGSLKISMVVNSSSKIDLMEEPVVVSSEINLLVPLLEQTIEASINKDAQNISDVVAIKEKSKDFKYVIYKILGFLLAFISVFHIVLAYIYNLSDKKESAYDIKLKKILKNYDSIIANVNNKPVVTGLKKIEVSDFDELLDVYNEVRMPINYYQDEKKEISMFLILNDTIVWYFELKKSDFDEENVKEKN